VNSPPYSSAESTNRSYEKFSDPRFFRAKFQKFAEQRQEFEARLKEQDANIQKVNARNELNKGAVTNGRE